MNVSQTFYILRSSDQEDNSKFNVFTSENGFSQETLQNIHKKYYIINL